MQAKQHKSKKDTPIEDDEKETEFYLFKDEEPIISFIRTPTEIQQRIERLKKSLSALEIGNYSTQVNFIAFEISTFENVYYLYKMHSFLETPIKDFLMKQYRHTRYRIILNETRGYNASLKNEMRYERILKYLLSPVLVEQIDKEIKLNSLKNYQHSLLFEGGVKLYAKFV